MFSLFWKVAPTVLGDARIENYFMLDCLLWLLWEIPRKLKNGEKIKKLMSYM